MIDLPNGIETIINNNRATTHSIAFYLQIIFDIYQGQRRAITRLTCDISNRIKRKNTKNNTAVLLQRTKRNSISMKAIIMMMSTLYSLLDNQIEMSCAFGPSSNKKVKPRPVMELRTVRRGQ